MRAWNKSWPASTHLLSPDTAPHDLLLPSLPLSPNPPPPLIPLDQLTHPPLTPATLPTLRTLQERISHLASQCPSAALRLESVGSRG